ncbi:MAG: ABC-type transport auxiliary lipoprotein family protein [Fibrobacterota bacterium]
MNSRRLIFISFLIFFISCNKPPVKKYFIMNYSPVPSNSSGEPYPFTLRIRDFSIEKAYSRSQIVYRRSPYEFSYYFYRNWAVKPADMITDLIYSHMTKSGLFEHTVRRLDEGYEPDFQLEGRINALEEYDSEDVWFAHLAYNIKLVNLRTGNTVYSRQFDFRKKVPKQGPEFVVKELSNILDMSMRKALADMDSVLSTSSIRIDK